MADSNDYDFLVSFHRNGKVIEQHSVKSPACLPLLRAIARSKKCGMDVFDLRDDNPEPALITKDEKPVEKQPKADKIKESWERPIMCVETGIIYWSIRECHRQTGIIYRSLCNAIKSGNPRNGLHFVSCSVSTLSTCRVYHPRSARRKTKSKAVECVTTGQRFESVQECIDKYRLPNTSFYRALSHGKPLRGLVFKYL